ncbi:MAG: YciI family protein [Planctomycetota bacterium]
MPKYMLILRGEESPEPTEFSPEEMQAILRQYEAWAGGLAQQGRLLDGQKLTDGDGRVMVPGAGDAVSVKDGPFQETKEVIGGFYLIRADSYDHAVKLCQGHPNFRFGSIEVREIDLMGQPDDA